MSQSAAEQQLTSFAFLDDKDETPNGTFNLGGVGDFFSKVRSAIIGDAAGTTGDQLDAPQREEEFDFGISWAEYRPGREPDKVSLTLPSREGSVKTFQSEEDASVSTKAIRIDRRGPSVALRTIGQSGASFGSAVATITPAVAQTSELSYRPVSNSNSGDASLADSRSIGAGGALHHAITRAGADSDDDEADETDVLGALNASGGKGTGFVRTSTIPQSDSITSGLFGFIPGFPLSKDLVADDARSIHSTSSSRPHLSTAAPRSDWDDTMTDYGGRSTPTNSSSAAVHGLQTSADAIWRRIRGEGLSRKFWMADEHVKECRECLSHFTPFRRKHRESDEKVWRRRFSDLALADCRLCGQIYCSRCASHLIPGARFGSEELIRVCNLCKRMLEEYEAEEQAAPPMDLPHDTLLRRATTRHISTPSTTMTQKVRPGMISAPLEAQVKAPQSQFAANHLFARANVRSNNGISQNTVATLLREHSKAAVETSPRIDETSSSAAAEPEETGAPAPFRKALNDEVVSTLDSEDPSSEAAAANEAGQETPAEEEVDVQMLESVAPSRVPSRATNRPPSVRPSLAARAAAVQDAHEELMANDMRPSLTAQAAVSHSLNLSVPQVEEPTQAQTLAALFQTDISSDPRVRLVGERHLAHSKSKTLLRSGETSHSGDPTSPELPHDDDAMGNDPVFPEEEPRPSSWFMSEVSEASLAHIRTMARQTLHGKVNQVDAWIEVLIPLVLKTISRICPNPRKGDAFNIREYVKIKRVPGGLPSDTQYVDGE